MLLQLKTGVQVLSYLWQCGDFNEGNMPTSEGMCFYPLIMKSFPNQCLFSIVLLESLQLVPAKSESSSIKFSLGSCRFGETLNKMAGHLSFSALIPFWYNWSTCSVNQNAAENAAKCGRLAWIYLRATINCEYKNLATGRHHDFIASAFRFKLWCPAILLNVSPTL